MFKGKTAVAVVAATILAANACFAQTLEENWKDFLHYTKIGRFDLAKGHAQALLADNPDPVALLETSRQNEQGYQIMVRVSETAPDAELVELSGKILALIERGRFLQRIQPKIIAEEVRRLSSTDRGWFAAVERLRNAGEYAIPFMLDALADPSREEELPHIVRALPQIGRDAIRPLTTALQTDNVALRAEIIKALGKIGYPQSAAYLKFVAEKDPSDKVSALARDSIRQIDPAMLNVPAAQLFYQIGENYYYHAESLAPAADADFANVWFWDAGTQKLAREEVARSYFNELMAMQSCEWALKADSGFGSAIGLWLAAFFKAESVGEAKMPAYFGDGHADALVYATTAGVEYLHQALARAVKDNNAYVALGVIEALATTAGEKSLLYEIGAAQPLLQALTFDDRKVRYSAAIAIAAAGPKEKFAEAKLVVANLAEALGQTPQPATENGNGWDQQVADSYALRAADVMLKVAMTRNPVLDLSAAQDALIATTTDKRSQMQVLAGQALAHFDSPGAQRAVAAMALEANNALDVRIPAFNSLATSARLNANMLPDETIDAVYALISSNETDPDLRSAAAAAYGALNLPSRKAKNLILDQAKS
ncbi:MAG TPA: HEAT repeat domain-containing protein [Sedimentisphaerales bacterium]|nr:HEAT repeat domain-containing protein [Sedimentisphaerales bacterium]